MNPDQPSREQIEARLTALLLGELPAEEAELLRWTISRDPELQRLHDQLKGTIGFVREAMKNPTGAPMDAGTPLKLPKERRQTLLAHFKTARPQPPQKSELSWLRRLKVSPLIPTLVVIAIIALLAAVLLPVLSTSKMRSLNEVSYLGKSESTAGIHNSYQNRGTYGVSGPQVTILPAAKTPPTPAPIALPNTESAQAKAGETGEVYSEQVVGYVNPQVPAANLQIVTNQLSFPNREPIVADDGGVVSADQANTASRNLQGQTKSISGADSPYVQKEFQNGVLATNYLANAIPIDRPQSPSGSAMSPSLAWSANDLHLKLGNIGQGGEIGGQSLLAKREIQNVNNGTVSFGDTSTVPPASASPALGLPTASVPELPQTTFQNPFAGRLQDALTSTANGNPNGNQSFNFPQDQSFAGNVTNTAAVDEGQLRTYGNNFGVGNSLNYSLPTGESRNAKRTIDNDERMVTVERAWSKPSKVTTNIALPPQAQQEYALNELQPRSPLPQAATSIPAGESGIENLKNQYQEQETQIQLMQSNVEQLRENYDVHDTDPNAIGPTAIVTSEQEQQLNEKIIEQNALVIQNQKEVAEFQAIQATNPGELPDALLTVKDDSALRGLLNKLHGNEQGSVAGSNYLSAENPESSSSVALKQEITNRVNGIMFSLQTEVEAEKAGLDTLNRRLEGVEGQGQYALAKDQPYWLAKQHLQDERDLHQLLGEKIEADTADASMPKSALVTVVASAQPGVSQNLWQRMTGQVESQASIKIEPDVTSSGPIGYAPYDPYYMETELNTIRGDVVLGKVVDSLNLDQAWSKKADGKKLSRNDAIAQLRSRLDLQSERNSKLIDIGAKSDSPEEAAKIANAVAEAYQQYRLEVHSNEMVAGIQHLQQMYVDEDKKIRELQAGLAGRNISLNESHGTREAAVTKVTKDKSDVWRAPQPTAPVPQPEIRTTDNGFSTFSLNVSDVSFKLAMASLEKGQMPAPASIRSEEFINAFDYHDPEPLQGEPLAFVSERASDPFAQERDMLRFSIKAAAAGRQDGRQLNLVLLLDTSGSMERADRVAIIREALRVLAGQLQPHDVVSVVTFARTARLWADGVPGDKAGATFDKVGSISPEGGTNLEEAMRLAYETALRHFIAGGMNRVVLMTDGAANLGNVDPEALTQKVDSERRQGIALDCFGIGWDDYNDDLLEQLSSNGDGRYAFINSPDEARTEFAAKLAGALQVAAEDVKVQVEFNPNRVTSWRQIGYAKHQLTKQQFRDNAVAAGAIASREAGNALYTIEPRADGEGPIATVRVRYRVPGTQDVHERSWLVEYTGAAPELAQSSPAMRLAVTAAETSEWLANSPFAQDVTPDELLNDLSGVPQIYGTDERPKQLEWMIREADALKR